MRTGVAGQMAGGGAGNVWDRPVVENMDGLKLGDPGLVCDLTPAKMYPGAR
jgi:hypothetical protein